jgi:Tol biopolymer transport system component
MLDILDEQVSDGLRSVLSRRSEHKRLEAGPEGMIMTKNTRNMVAAAAAMLLAFTAIRASAEASQGNGAIAYASTQGETAAIFLTDERGKDPVQITRPEGIDAHPSFSPDGQKIAFSRSVGGNFDIYVMNADGSGVQRLTTSAAVDLVPSFSLDGKRIAFESNRDGEFRIYVMNADGADQRRITYGPGSDMGAKFSPDGTLIAFASDRGGDGYDMYVMGADGTGLKRLTTGAHNDFSRSWSPDSREIAFNGNRHGTGQIFIMDRDGGNMRQVTDNPGSTPAFSPGGLFPSFRGDVTPVWSPDGRKVVFSSDRNGHFEIYTINTNGTGLKRLTNTPQTYQNISLGWQAVP